MKKILLFILIIGLNISSYAQLCLPNGVIFSNQEDIDNFSTIYPSCTKIIGNVEVTGDNITNLNGLSQINQTMSSFSVTNTTLLTTLEGLNNLDSVGGNLSFSNNLGLTDVTALGEIAYVPGDLQFIDCPLIEDLEGVHNITKVDGFVDLMFLNTLKNLHALRNLEYVGEYLSLEGLSYVKNLEGLDNIDSLGGLAYVYCDSIQSFSGINQNISFIGNLLLVYNPAFNSFEGIEGINTFSSLQISDNDNLVSLSGLQNITHIYGGLVIEGNDLLNNLSGLENLVTVNGVIIVSHHSNLNTLIGIENIRASSIEKIMIFDNSNLSECEVKSVCDYIAIPTSVVTAYDNSEGCSSVAEIDTACAYASINTMSFEELYHIYPQPASNRLNIDRYNGSEIENVKIYNQMGSLLINISEPGKTIDITLLKPGMYVIEIDSGSKKYRRKLIVI